MTAIRASVVDLDPHDFGRLDRIQEGKNDPQKKNKKWRDIIFEVLDILFWGPRLLL
jgi:hypothetical protein